MSRYFTCFYIGSIISCLRKGLIFWTEKFSPDSPIFIFEIPWTVSVILCTIYRKKLSYFKRKILSNIFGCCHQKNDSNSEKMMNITEKKTKSLPGVSPEISGTYEQAYATDTYEIYKSDTSYEYYRDDWSQIKPIKRYSQYQFPVFVFRFQLWLYSKES